jgi:hypothetical protein
MWPSRTYSDVVVNDHIIVMNVLYKLVPICWDSQQLNCAGVNNSLVMSAICGFDTAAARHLGLL